MERLSHKPVVQDRREGLVETCHTILPVSTPNKFVVATRRRQKITGKPDRKGISTSMVERQNLTMRMSMRRFTRRTNAFSKKFENFEHAVALHFMYYNFCRIHQTLRVTPAMEAGVTDKLWNIEDIVKLVEEREHTR